MAVDGKSCTVIGGGISGLIAATILQRSGMRVVVLDKGRGIGGRLATRRLSDEKYGEGVFDYGAQYFTVKDARYREWVNRWHASNIVTQWSEGFCSHEQRFKLTGIPMYRGRESNRSIGKFLADSLDVRTGTRVVEMQWLNMHWLLKTANQESYESDLLLMTPPVPQVLELFENSGIDIADHHLEGLRKIRYHRCIAVLLLLQGPSRVVAPGGVWMHGEPISWIADNHIKGISPDGIALTVHMGPKYSLDNWDTPEEEIVETILQNADQWIGAEVTKYHVHRWKYSQAADVYGESFLHIRQPGDIILAGDGFTGGRLESAAVSGIEAANYMIAQ